MHRPAVPPALLLFVALSGCASRPTASTGDGNARAATPGSSDRPAYPAEPQKPTRPPLPPRQAKIVESARKQIGDAYVADYVAIRYPNGDAPARTGACTDVVVRSLRAIGIDLQRLVHEDMKRNFSLYPKRWGLRRPDTNIDHRRVPNLVVFFKRFGKTLPAGVTGSALATWKPGDIVMWILDNGRDHCGVITETTGPSGLPTVVHNLGSCAEEDCLTAWRIVGHYRYPKDL